MTEKEMLKLEDLLVSYLRVRELKLKYPGEKYSFDEVYNNICMERYLKNRGGQY